MSGRLDGLDQQDQYLDYMRYVERPLANAIPDRPWGTRQVQRAQMRRTQDAEKGTVYDIGI